MSRYGHVFGVFFENRGYNSLKVQMIMLFEAYDEALECSQNFNDKYKDTTKRYFVEPLEIHWKKTN